MTEAAARPARLRLPVGSGRAGLLVLLVLMEAIFALIEPRVVSRANVLNVVQQASYLVVFTIAQTCVILTRGFDLSLGTCVSVVSVASALVLTRYGEEPGAAVLLLGLAAGLGCGLVVGLFNGCLVAWLGLNPFIVTLGSLNICLGVATTISGGTPVFGVPESFSVLLNDGTVFGLRAPVVVAAGVALAVWFVLGHTVFGRTLYLLGANPRAVMVAGLPGRACLAGAYALCSTLAALGALMLTARTGSGEPNLGGSLMLQSIAAAVIGGTSLRGGTGGVGSAVLGALFITMLSNGMNLLRINGYVQAIVLGIVVVATTALDFRRGARG